MAIPTMLVFKNGEMVKAHPGRGPKRMLKEAFDETLAI